MGMGFWMGRVSVHLRFPKFTGAFLTRLKRHGEKKRALFALEFNFVVLYVLNALKSLMNKRICELKTGRLQILLAKRAVCFRLSAVENEVGFERIRIQH